MSAFTTKAWEILGNGRRGPWQEASPHALLAEVAKLRRAAADKYIVREPSTEEKVWWGNYNRPFATDKFNALLQRLQTFLQGEELFVQDCHFSADPDYRMPIRVITDSAWQSLFARNMFIPIDTHVYCKHAELHKLG